MQAEEQVKVGKDRKKVEKLVADSQERAYWRVHRPPPGALPPLDPAGPIASLRKNTNPPQHNSQVEILRRQVSRSRVKASQAVDSLVNYCSTYAEYDPFLTAAQPSNPWLSDDPAYWQFNQPIVEVPTDKRVKKWALSFEDLLSDPSGVEEFTQFLRKEYSHENIRFWQAVKDLRRCSQSQVPTKVKSIYEEFLVHGAPCEINIDSKTLESTLNEMKTPSRFVFDVAAHHVYNVLLNKDCYPRFIRSDHYKNLLATALHPPTKKRFFGFVGGGKKKSCGGGSSIGSAAAMGVATGGSSLGSSVGAGSGSSSIVAASCRRGSDRSLSGFLQDVPGAHPSLSSSQANLHELSLSRDTGISPDRIAVPGSEGKHVSFEKTASGEDDKILEDVQAKPNGSKIPQISRLASTKSHMSESFDAVPSSFSSSKDWSHFRSAPAKSCVEMLAGLERQSTESIEEASVESTTVAGDSQEVEAANSSSQLPSNVTKASEQPSGSNDVPASSNEVHRTKETPVIETKEVTSTVTKKISSQPEEQSKIAKEDISPILPQRTPSASKLSPAPSIDRSVSHIDPSRKFSVTSLKEPIVIKEEKLEIKSEESLMKIEYHLEKRTVDLKSDSKSSISAVSTEKLSFPPSPARLSSAEVSKVSTEMLISPDKISSPVKSIEKLPSASSLSIEKLTLTSVSTERLPALAGSTDDLPISIESIEKIPSAPLASAEQLSTSSTEKLPSPSASPEPSCELVHSESAAKSLDNLPCIVGSIEKVPAPHPEHAHKLTDKSASIEEPTLMKKSDKLEFSSSAGGSTAEVGFSGGMTLEEAKAVLKGGTDKRLKKVNTKIRVMSEDQHRWEERRAERKNLSVDDEELSGSPKKSTDKGVVSTSTAPGTQPADICPWEDEESCKTEETFVKKYATLGYL